MMPIHTSIGGCRIHGQIEWSGVDGLYYGMIMNTPHLYSFAGRTSAEAVTAFEEAAHEFYLDHLYRKPSWVVRLTVGLAILGLAFAVWALA